jgi:DEAD/DEAH box helicase domain-containing protein
MRKVTFDIETKNLFSDTGSNDPASLDISIVCIHDSETDTYASFLQEEFKNLWPILEKTDILIGFNSDHFDIPLLNKYYPGDLTKIKSLDLLKEVKNSLGRRIKLDTLAKATLGTRKIGDGLEALRWWREGNIDALRTYCIEDVRITKELYDYAKKNGSLKYLDGARLRDIKLDTSAWDIVNNQSLTHTLPF